MLLVREVSTTLLVLVKIIITTTTTTTTINEIWHRKICHAHNEELKDNRNNKTAESRKNQNA